MTGTADVVVVGGGLPGLSATRLRLAGAGATVLEAGDDVGGRVRTDVVDGRPGRRWSRRRCRTAPIRGWRCGCGTACPASTTRTTGPGS
ncbi:NAD(P)-binding protein [Amycolatopsis nalaikhensis]|uniref:NAD(P)-binding protein n=1 Tax=Amycolatopsis nalaikhensis TaxID=715472 RepID=A0ABY8XMS4_9PSEU|nr:NAD(P)-binding protein [Amycolatopsis sp. 2-2]WIV56929.1 NAD(P)-binding protein [Amycolatopsis sp. 2-2]